MALPVTLAPPPAATAFDAASWLQWYVELRRALMGNVTLASLAEIPPPPERSPYLKSDGKEVSWEWIKWLLAARRGINVVLDNVENVIDCINGGGFKLWTDNFADTPGRDITLIRRDYLHFGANTNTFGVGPNNGLQFTGTGAATINFVPWVPTRLGGAAHQSQFSEAKYLADNGIVGSANRGGLCCSVVGDGGTSTQTGGSGFNQGYFLVFLKESSQMAVQRLVNNATPTNLITGLSVSLGDIVQLRATFLGGSVKLEVFRNGVSVGNTTDSTIPLESGLPGMWCRENPVGRVFELGNYRAGTLEFA